MMTKGTPGNVTPRVRMPASVWRFISYQTGGASSPRCGSLASNGRPLAVNAPLTTQLFEPTSGGASNVESHSTSPGPMSVGAGSGDVSVGRSSATAPAASRMIGTSWSNRSG